MKKIQPPNLPKLPIFREQENFIPNIPRITQPSSKYDFLIPKHHHNLHFHCLDIVFKNQCPLKIISEGLKSQPWVVESLVEYCGHKKDTELLNFVLDEYIKNGYYLFSSTFVHMLYALRVNISKMPIEFSNHLVLYATITSGMNGGKDLAKFFFDQIKLEDIEDHRIVEDILVNNLELISIDKLKLKLLENKKIFNMFEVFYSHQPPISDYISPEIIHKHNIDPSRKDAIRVLLQEHNYDAIRDCYETTSNTKLLNLSILPVVQNAETSNSLKLVEYLIDKGIEVDNTSIEMCAYNGNIETLKLFGKITDTAIKYAAYNGQDHIIEWLYSKGQGFSNNILSYALESDDINTINFLYSRNFKVYDNAIENIAIKGSFKTLNFLMSKGIPLDQNIIGSLVTGGHIEIMKSLYVIKMPVISVGDKFYNQNYIELNDTTVKKSHFEYIGNYIPPTNLLTDGENTEIKAYYQKIPVDEGSIQTAARHCHEDLLDLLISENAPATTLAMDDAIIRGYLSIVKKLYNYNHSLITNYNITLAWLWNRHDILNFLEEKGISTKFDCNQLRIELNEIIRTVDIFDQDYTRAKDLLSFLDGTIIESLSTYCRFGDINGVIDAYHKQNYIGNNILGISVMNGHLHIVEYLIGVGYNEKLLESAQIAARRNRLEILKVLLPLLNADDIPKIIESAISRGRLNIVKYLIDITEFRKEYITSAEKHNYINIVKYLKNSYNT